MNQKKTEIDKPFLLPDDHLLGRYGRDFCQVSEDIGEREGEGRAQNTPITRGQLLRWRQLITNAKANQTNSSREEKSSLESVPGNHCVLAAACVETTSERTENNRDQIRQNQEIAHGDLTPHRHFSCGKDGPESKQENHE
jgi:hypothetical protein